MTQLGVGDTTEPDPDQSARGADSRRRGLGPVREGTLHGGLPYLSAGPPRP